jgi:hypothetical protein
MKNLIVGAIVIIIIAVGVYFVTKSSTIVVDVPEQGTPSTVTPTPTTTPVVAEPVTPPVNEKETTIGTSVGERTITAYHYGKGDTEILFVGGIHGGYSWNTALVAYELMDYLEENPTAIPPNVKVTVIPVLNPDGLFKVVGAEGRFTSADVSSSQATRVAGRFNENTVDLNRNFDCDWQSKGVWMTKTVSGGSKAFSEPESLAFKGYVEAHAPTAVVTWFSSASGVFPSSCHNGVSAETKNLTSLYAKASGYKAYESYDFYEITGDMVNWLAKKNIAGISVLLTTHQDTEWTKNLAGIKAVLNYYAK